MTMKLIATTPSDTGVVPISKGGTNATTADDAMSNLAAGVSSRSYKSKAVNIANVTGSTPQSTQYGQILTGYDAALNNFGYIEGDHRSSSGDMNFGMVAHRKVSGTDYYNTIKAGISSAGECIYMVTSPMRFLRDIGIMSGEVTFSVKAANTYTVAVTLPKEMPNANYRIFFSFITNSWLVNGATITPSGKTKSGFSANLRTFVSDSASASNTSIKVAWMTVPF